MSVDTILTERNKYSLAELYHTNTKLTRWNSRDYGIRIETFYRTPGVDRITSCSTYIDR